MLKVTKYEHGTFNELEMADDKQLGGHPMPPPPVFFSIIGNFLLINFQSLTYSLSGFSLFVPHTWLDFCQHTG